MARRRPTEIFMPPNMLKAKAGGGLGGVDHVAVKRGESAVAAMAAEFSAMMAADVDALAAAHARHAEAPGTETRAALMRAAHDIRGQAATFQFPLIARAAGSLARLLTGFPAGRALPGPLAAAHVGVIQAILRQKAQGENDPTALALCDALDARVSACLART